MRALSALIAPMVASGLAGCVRQPAPPVAGAVHYIVGGGYQLGGAWSYPREDFHLDETGLAAVLADKRGVTADGEGYDPTAMVAAHRTLQLPAIVRVTNLDSGLQVAVRVNDRGPDEAGRVIGLSPRAAAVLGVAPEHAAPVRVQVDEGMSEALRAQLGGGPTVAVAAAPRTGVVAEALPPPSGVGQSRRGRDGAVVQALSSAAADTADARVPDRLPEVAQRVAVAPVRLLIRAGSFGRMEYASRLQARLAGLGARIERVREGRSERYEVVAGPFADVPAADAGLDRAVRAGVTDARIVAE